MDDRQHGRRLKRRASGTAAIIVDTVRGMRGHRRRILPSVVAVILGVAFTAGTLILTDTLRMSFATMHTDNHADTDLAVRAPASFGSGADAARDRVPAEIVTAVADVDGVAAAAGRTSGWAQLAATDGTLLGDVASGVDPTGETWIAHPGLTPWVLTAGRAPVGADQTVIDVAAAHELGVGPGDTVELLALGGARTMTVSGLAAFGAADSRFGTVTVFFDEPTSQRLLGEPGRHDSVLVAVAPGTPVELVADRIRTTATDAGIALEVVTGAQLADEAHALHMQDWAFFDTMMAGFAGVALLVGAFIIFNTFSITVAQRSREFALLRAVGAGRGQLLGSVIVEAILIGVLASGVGLVAGTGVARALHATFSAFGIDLPTGGVVVQAGSLVIAFFAGVVVTGMSALSPALRAARVRPLAAMREAAVDRAATSRPRMAIGAIVVMLGTTAMLVGLEVASSASLVGLGGVAVFVGATVLGPVFVRPFARLAGAPVVRLRGVAGQLAQDNAMRSPKRTAATAGALTVGVGLVGFITVLAASVKASIDDMVSTGVSADVVVDSNSVGLGGLDRSFAGRVRALPEVTAASGVSVTAADLDGEVVEVIAVTSTDIEAVLDLGRVEGSIVGANGAGLGTERIVVNAELAAERGWSLGTEVSVTLADGEPNALVIGAIVDDPYLDLPPIVDAQLFDRVGLVTFDLQVFAALDSTVDRDAGLAAVSAVAVDFPQADVVDRAGFADNRAALVDPLLGVIYALLAFAVLIAVLGIVNTLALSIMERIRELGVLRALGATRAQVRTMVRWESVMIAGFGTSIGLVIGTGFGWALVRALEGEGVSRLVVPVTQLAVVAGLAAAGGVIAAVGPARRAARIDVLDAVRS